MKLIRNVIIAYTVLMAIALFVMLLFVGRYDASLSDVGSYSDAELEMYKAIWSDINKGVESSQHNLLLYCVVFWGVLLVIGYIFIAAVYIIQIKPIRDMESVATEIAKGNLDAILPMRRGNMLGGVTESFDLMREELKSAKEKELAAEHAKREMVAELSHDLKTPVATIQATCEVLEMKVGRKLSQLREELESLGEDETDEKLAAKTAEKKAEEEELNDLLEKAGYISSKSETINQLVQSVFKANLEDMDEIQVSPVETDSRVIIGFFKELKDYGNILLENDIPECLVYLDTLRMSQVVDNIVGNAYKYAGTDVHVSFSEVNNLPGKNGKKNNYIKIKIKDDGPGVPEDELPLVIEKYYRGSDSKEKSGYGLGLYLVKWYMEKQGGGMEYYNDNGFVVELLVKKV